MTNNEQELLNLIRESGNKELALVTAVEIIAVYLAQSGSYPTPFADSQRGLA